MVLGFSSSKNDTDQFLYGEAILVFMDTTENYTFLNLRPTWLIKCCFILSFITIGSPICKHLADRRIFTHTHSQASQFLYTLAISFDMVYQ